MLVSTGEVNAVAMENDRQVMTYFATGGIALIVGDKMAPGGSFECVGMIDAASDGMTLTLSYATTDTDGDMVYSEVTRGKDSNMPRGQGVYAYTGGTGKWSEFMADATYEVHTQPGGQGLEFGHCTGGTLPLPIADWNDTSFPRHEPLSPSATFRRA